MTWSGRKSFAVLADAYTTGVCEQTVLQISFVRYTSYELLCHRFGLILGFTTYFFSIKIFLVIKLYTITTAVAPTLVII